MVANADVGDGPGLPLEELDGAIIDQLLDLRLLVLRWPPARLLESPIDLPGRALFVLSEIQARKLSKNGHVAFLLPSMANVLGPLNLLVGFPLNHGGKALDLPRRHRVEPVSSF